jgi:hypothetical protein
VLATTPSYRDDQSAHERFIAEEFVEHLAREEATLATDLRAGDQARGEPDAVCIIDGVEHGIELVDCWQSNDQAKETWSLARDAQHRGIRRRMVASSSGPGMPHEAEPHPSGDLLAATAERRLTESIKAYGIPTWLILNASQSIAPLHSAGEGAWLVQQIRKPSRCPYKDVYLCLARNWEQGRRFFRIP